MKALSTHCWTLRSWLDLFEILLFVYLFLSYQLRLVHLSYVLPLWLQLQSTSVSGVTDAFHLSTPLAGILGRSKAKAAGWQQKREANVKALCKPTKDGILYKAWHRVDIHLKPVEWKDERGKKCRYLLLTPEISFLFSSSHHHHHQERNQNLLQLGTFAKEFPKSPITGDFPMYMLPNLWTTIQ